VRFLSRLYDLPFKEHSITCAEFSERGKHMTHAGPAFYSTACECGSLSRCRLAMI